MKSETIILGVLSAALASTPVSAAAPKPDLPVSASKVDQVPTPSFAMTKLIAARADTLQCGVVFPTHFNQHDIFSSFSRGQQPNNSKIKHPKQKPPAKIGMVFETFKPA